MSQTHLIYSDLFYILSGPSASGKSSLTKQLVEQGLPEDAIVSTDTIRKQILGSSFSVDQYGVRERLTGWELNKPEVFHIIENILSLRFKQRLPTFFDATNLDDDTREIYVNLASQYGIKTHIVIFNVPKEELEKRLSNRKERFNFSVVEKQLEIFSLSSKFPFTIAEANDTFILLPNLLLTTNLDVVGDVHGLLEETILLLEKTNWYLKDSTFINKDPNRKVLFLGDAVDRGTQSIEFMQSVMNTVNSGHGFFILGNHEAKLIASYELYKKEGLVRGKSISSSQTFFKFLTLSEQEQETMYKFLLFSPTHYSLWINKETGLAITPKNNMIVLSEETFKIAFGHANNDYYNPYAFPRSHALYGRRRSEGAIDTDENYEKNYLEGLNKYVYIRGHTINESEQNHVYSLEDNQAFAGNLVTLKLDSYISALKDNNWKSTHQLFKENIVKQKSEFNFDEATKDSTQLLKKMSALVKEGLVTDGWRKDESGVKQAHADGFKVYKYSKKVHFKRLWKTEPMLEKARGLVLNSTGDIIVHPFDKLYNFGEYDVGADVNPEQKVQMIEKLNGFLGCISKHPFRNELLISTTGSLASPFVQFIADFIDEKTKNTLLNYFKDNKKTLMFEVIHPDDKHIIEYDPKDHGLWLIGARGLNFNDQVDTESQLDNIATKLNLKRAKWTETTFKEVLEKLPHSELEGYMIRNAETQEPLMKIKTNYYLVTKFMGRMGLKLTASMYKNPEQFKKNHVEEEFYPIVDEIVATMPQDKFEALEQKDRVEFVRNIIDTQRENVQKQKNSKLKI